jgi:hypothetical protein
VTLRHGWRGTLIGGACVLLPTRAARPQIHATVDLGASAVRYDGFLLSGALALTPAFTWDGARGALTLRGTYLRFESGNRSLQGSMRGSFFTRPARGWRGELSASAGASSYASFATFWHTLGDLRLHRGGERRGAWIGVTAGRTSFGTAVPARPVVAASGAVWLRRDQLTLLVSAHRAFVGDTQYSDIDLTVRAQRGKLALETVAGGRVWSRGAGRGLFGEGSGIVALNDRVGLVLSGGRYPTDPIRGSIASRYVAVAVRLRVRSIPARDPPYLLTRAGRAGANGDSSAPVTLAVHTARDGLVRLVIHGPPAGASLVEIAGDFTEWQPVPLRQTAAGTWEALVPISRGVHRINVRVAGGAWIAPAGITRVRDEYDGDVGVFIVP